MDDVALVRLGNKDRFRLEKGIAIDCAVEERARLDREWRANPMLWPPAARRQQLADALLVGGGQILDRPMFRFDHGPDTELETWLRLDGGAAGYALRDPIRRAKLQWHFGDKIVRVVKDGDVELGWKIEGPTFDAIADDVFERPQ